jgi:hypothetical protein
LRAAFGDTLRRTALAVEASFPAAGGHGWDARLEKGLRTLGAMAAAASGTLPRR